ncbi:unnamed protein product [Thlaspi arvense]|uniref:TIR domain-containing protein n=1 Tax=Thlaspi arvense TaxID=13288 RepID=A0AAU9RNZ0_THLAR|nr:unnamed protein product [Thlaspi arvense]
MASSSSSSPSVIGLTRTGPQVFINFRGLDIRRGILSFLVPALSKENVNVFIDDREVRGEHLTNLFQRIEESKIALAIFSEKYSTSEWCLDELAKIYECVKIEKLNVIPVFYKVKVASVKYRTGDFGDQYRRLRGKHNVAEPARVQSWKDALMSVPLFFGLSMSETSGKTDKDFVDEIVKEVKKSLEEIKARKPEAIQERHPEAIQERQQPEAAQIRQAVVERQGNMINVRQLKISSSFNARYWTFVSLSESPNEVAIEVAKMRECPYLDVCGKLDTKELTSGTKYEVVFVVKVEDTMSRWDYPAKVQLMVPDKELQERELQFVDLIKNEWVDIQAGVFVAQPHKEKVAFCLYQHNADKKMTGLQVKGAIVRPKE